MIFNGLKNLFQSLLYNEYTRAEYFIKKGSQIGKCNRIYTLDFGSEPYLIKIGNHCTISSGVKFITHDGGTWVLRRENPNVKAFGKIEIKDNCFIGLNTIILPGVTVGPNAVVGAGAVVTHDVPPNCVVAGVPAKIISSINDYKNKCLEKKGNDLKFDGSRSNKKKQLMDYFWKG